MERSQADKIINIYSDDPSQLIGILQDIQAKYNYLPADSLMEVSGRLNVPVSRLYSIATFFKTFSLIPRGRHIITVCLGTACHVRKAPRLVDEIGRLLGIGPGETTADRMFTLETVNCLGACALGPVVVIDGTYYGKMTSRQLGKLLEEHRDEQVMNHDH